MIRIVSIAMMLILGGCASTGNSVVISKKNLNEELIRAIQGVHDLTPMPGDPSERDDERDHHIRKILSRLSIRNLERFVMCATEIEDCVSESDRHVDVVWSQAFYWAISEIGRRSTPESQQALEGLEWKLRGSAACQVIISEELWKIEAKKKKK